MPNTATHVAVGSRNEGIGGEFMAGMGEFPGIVMELQMTRHRTWR